MSNAATTLVMCLCAEWCGVCRDYRDGFDALSQRYAEVRFHWVDIEDAPEWPEALEIEHFPTVMIQRCEHVLYLGATLPQHTHLARTLESLLEMDDDEARRYAESSEERRSWQIAASFRNTLR